MEQALVGIVRGPCIIGDLYKVGSGMVPFAYSGLVSARIARSGPYHWRCLLHIYLDKSIKFALPHAHIQMKSAFKQSVLDFLLLPIIQREIQPWKDHKAIIARASKIVSKPCVGLIERGREEKRFRSVVALPDNQRGREARDTATF